jgi:4-hydroxybutyrate CoA-transferase
MSRVVSAEALWPYLDGCRVLVPSGCGHPVGLLNRLAGQEVELELVAGILSGGFDFLDAASPGVRLTSWQLTAQSRDRFESGRLKLIPARYSQLTRLFGPGGAYPVDALVVHASPPDRHGMCTLGVAPSYCAPLAARVPLLIAYVNDQMPRTAGHDRFHIDDAEFVVEVSEPLAEVPRSSADERDLAVARNVASLIRDGDTVQMGIGRVPEALTSVLGDHRDLGICGMLTDASLDLVTAGVANGGGYGPAPGTIEVGEIMGSRRLYDHVDGNPRIRAVSAEHGLSPATFAAIPAFVAVNSAVEVDLTGQATAESVGHRQISGPGGQLDYMEGAMASPRGRSVIALPATANGGRSRIVCHLTPGAVVTTPRNCVSHVVTEFGVAELEGRSTVERAAALAAIAAPEFRDELAHAHCRAT